MYSIMPLTFVICCSTVLTAGLEQVHNHDEASALSAAVVYHK
jgi:hypothetical protein